MAPYEALATRDTPALVIYVLDISQSMTKLLGNKRRIDVVNDAMNVVLDRMISRSMTGPASISPRYRLAVFAYNDQVRDLLGGVKTIDEVVDMYPDLKPAGSTNTLDAFQAVKNLLEREIPQMGHCPAPLVCHMTDGIYTSPDPEPVVREIMQMRVPDGNVLVENIFISDDILPTPISTPRQWPGVMADTPLTNEYAIKLRAMSSPLPETYRANMVEDGYHMASDSFMLLPGVSPELVEMGFVMSGMTPTR